MAPRTTRPSLSATLGPVALYLLISLFLIVFVPKDPHTCANPRRPNTTPLAPPPANPLSEIAQGHARQETASAWPAGLRYIQVLHDKGHVPPLGKTTGPPCSGRVRWRFRQWIAALAGAWKTSTLSLVSKGLPLLRAIIVTMLIVGGVEENPGPTPPPGSSQQTGAPHQRGGGRGRGGGGGQPARQGAATAAAAAAGGNNRAPGPGRTQRLHSGVWVPMTGDPAVAAGVPRMSAPRLTQLLHDTLHPSYDERFDDVHGLVVDQHVYRGLATITAACSLAPAAAVHDVPARAAWLDPRSDGGQAWAALSPAQRDVVRRQEDPFHYPLLSGFDPDDSLKALASTFESTGTLLTAAAIALRSYIDEFGRLTQEHNQTAASLFNNEVRQSRCSIRCWGGNCAGAAIPALDYEAHAQTHAELARLPCLPNRPAAMDCAISATIAAFASFHPSLLTTDAFDSSAVLASILRPCQLHLSALVRDTQHPALSAMKRNANRVVGLTIPEVVHELYGGISWLFTGFSITAAPRRGGDNDNDDRSVRCPNCNAEMNSCIPAIPTLSTPNGAPANPAGFYPDLLLQEHLATFRPTCEAGACGIGLNNWVLDLTQIRGIILHFPTGLTAAPVDILHQNGTTVFTPVACINVTATSTLRGAQFPHAVCYRREIKGNTTTWHELDSNTTRAFDRSPNPIDVRYVFYQVSDASSPAAARRPLPPAAHWDHPQPFNPGMLRQSPAQAPAHPKCGAQLSAAQYRRARIRAPAAVQQQQQQAAQPASGRIDDLRYASWNVEGRLTAPLWQAIVNRCNPDDFDVIALQEIGTVTDDQVIMAAIRAQWQPFVHQQRRAAGGAMLLVANRHVAIAQTPPPQPFHAALDVVVAAIHREGMKPITFANAYFAPGLDGTRIATSQFEAALLKLDADANADIYVGDLNARHPYWERHHTVAEIDDRAYQCGCALLRVVQAAGLCIPRAPEGGTLRLHRGADVEGAPDVFLSSLHPVETDLQRVHLPVLSDHDLIIGRVSFPLAIHDPQGPGPPDRTYTPHRVANLKGALPRQVEEARAELRKRLKSTRGSPNMRHAQIVAAIQAATALLPTRERSIASQARRDEYRRRVDEIMGQYHDARQLPPSPLRDERIAEARKKFTELRAEADTAAEGLWTKFEASVKATWKRVGQMLHPPPRHAPVTFAEGQPAVASQHGQATGFNKLFASKHRATLAREKVSPRVPGPIPQISAVELVAAIRTSMKASHCPDADGIAIDFIDTFIEEIAPALLLLYNQVLACSTIPDAWRDATVVPLLKPQKAPEEAKSYRPVSLLSILFRVFERIMLTRLQAHLTRDESQCGFTPGVGVDNALQHFVLAVRDGYAVPARHYQRNVPGTARLDIDVDNLRTLAAFVDLTDAYCRVHVNDVIDGYRALGGPSYYETVIINIMSDRCQRVRVGNYMSSYESLDLGVPQGSILAPMLFLLATHSLRRTLDASLARHTPTIHPGGGDLPTCGPMPVAHDGIRWHGQIMLADDSAIWVTGADLFLLSNAMELVLADFAAWATSRDYKISPKSTAQIFIKKRPHDLGLDTDIVLGAQGRHGPNPQPPWPAHANHIADHLTNRECTWTPIHQHTAHVLRCGEVVIAPTLETQGFLGLRADRSLNFLDHAEAVAQQLQPTMQVLKAIRDKVPANTMRILVNSLVTTKLAYQGHIVGPCICEAGRLILERLHLASARYVTGALKPTQSGDVFLAARMAPLTKYMREYSNRMSAHLAELPTTSTELTVFRQNAEVPPTIHWHAPMALWAPTAASRAPSPRDWLRVDEIGPVRPSIHWATRLYAPDQTAEAARVSFLPPCHFTLTADAAKRAFNQARADNIPDGAYVLVVDGSVIADPDRQLNSAAYAFALHRKDGRHFPIHHISTKSLGPDHISFTAEAYGHRDALRYIHDLGILNRADQLYVLGDAWSVFSYLHARGPIHARNVLMHEIWDAAMLIPCQITFAFIYAHCEFRLQDRVDYLANLTAASIPPPPHIETLPIAKHRGGALTADDLRLELPSLADELRPASNIRLRFAPDSARLLDDNERIHQGPPLPCQQIVQLRMGTSSLARGFLADQDERCRACDKVLVSRDGAFPMPPHAASKCNAVEHLFACPALKHLREAAGFDEPAVGYITPAVLWTDIPTTSAYLSLVRAFFIAQQ